jgi:hypothetical protein
MVARFVLQGKTWNYWTRVQLRETCAAQQSMFFTLRRIRQAQPQGRNLPSEHLPQVCQFLHMLNAGLFRKRRGGWNMEALDGHGHIWTRMDTVEWGGEVGCFELGVASDSEIQ